MWQPAAGTNNAAPGRLAARDEDAKAVALTYSQSLGLSTETGPNGDTGTVTYDSYGRVASRKSPHGATTTYSYDYPNRQVTATTGARWVRTTSDGLGRTLRVENGTGTTVISTVDTEYAPCACSPLGKVKRVSQPYAPGGAVYWTTYTYDGLGRTTSVTLPDGSVTTYAYAGNTVTVTDPAGKWKKYTRDAMGNLTVDTYYTYDLLNHLTQVSMRRLTLVSPPTYTTQTRTFTYDPATQRLASATNPENGTISYVYNSDGTLNRTTDAQAQRTQYTYDLFGRVIQIDRYRSDGTQDPCQSVTYTYDYNLVQDAWVSVNPRGRLTGVKWGDPNGTCPGSVQFEEQYTYTTGGLVEHKRLQLTQAANTGYLDAYYTHDPEGRPVTHNLTTPVWNSQMPTTLVSYGYGLDALGRPASMERAYGNNPKQTIVSNVQWGAAGELKQMDYGVGLPYRETRAYNARLQMTNTATTVNGAPLTNLTYTFPAAPSNNGRVSQLIDSVSGLADETVTYQYDSLNRLSQAAGSGWSWSYAYDGFGNRTQQGSSNWLYDAQTNRLSGAGWAYDANGNLTADPLGRQYSYDVANRLVSAGGETYVYDSQNRRICKNSCTALTFYGASGERLGTFQPNITYNVITFQLLIETVHFAGKLIQSDNQWVATDRLGSVRADSSNGRFRYYPYGEEYTTTTQDRTKFATYYRDQSTALDYADQRYYASTTGRFLTADPYQASGSPANPQSWNQYAYVRGDPVNRVDPQGLMDSGVEYREFEDNGAFGVMEYSMAYHDALFAYQGGHEGSDPWWAALPSYIGFVESSAMEGGGAGGGGGRAVDSATTANARGLLSRRLAHFKGSNCWKVLGHEGVKVQNILDHYSEENFYDVRGNSQFAGLSLADIGISGSDGSTLNQLLGGRDAAVVGTLGSSSTTAVLVGTQYFFPGNTNTIRMNSLLHEMLHALGGVGDSQILGNKYFLNHGLVDKGYGDTSGITDWLTRDCKK